MPTHRKERTTNRRTVLKTAVLAPPAMYLTTTGFPTASAAGGFALGMSTPANEWDRAIRETGMVESRRLFSPRLTADPVMNEVLWCHQHNVLPVVSFKLGDWRAAAAGALDRQIRAVRDKLARTGQPVTLSAEHEPYGKGQPSMWARVQHHVIPLLKAPNITAGPIMNGFPWGTGGGGWSDEKIAQYLPDEVLRVSDFVAGDTYQAGDFPSQAGASAASKMANFDAWAGRHGVDRLGVPEWNAWTGPGITEAVREMRSRSRFMFACIYNSNGGSRNWKLSGDRLAAFRAALA